MYIDHLTHTRPEGDTWTFTLVRCGCENYEVRPVQRFPSGNYLSHPPVHFSTMAAGLRYLQSL